MGASEAALGDRAKDQSCNRECGRECGRACDRACDKAGGRESDRACDKAGGPGRDMGPDPGRSKTRKKPRESVHELAHEPARVRLLERGPTALSDAELLSLLIRPGSGGESTQALAAALLSDCGGLGALFSADRDRLLRYPGIGPGTLALLLAAMELARRCAQQPLRQSAVMSSPERTREFLRHHLGGRDREVFCCLFLDAQHRLLRCEDLFLGTLDGAAVYPREIVVRVLRYRAAAVILAHNHPSGVVTPSTADRQITERLQRALSLLDVPVLDHIVIGGGDSLSFAEAGLL